MPRKALIKLILIIVALAPAVFAQSGSKPSKEGSSGAQSCDGALDIVPDKSMTFIRKRRPGNPATGAPAKKPGKTERKSKT
ncbi:MAG: hypothetical protein IPM66_05495 [Acidobacteriota bacterium]|nr:MAG: hypothetical protein IPM66_05495 [Acidobacteriota bacterium]